MKNIPSNEEIDCVVRQFKEYMKKIIPNMAIDFARKYKLEKEREIALGDYLSHNKEISPIDTYISKHHEFKIEYLRDEKIIAQVMRLNNKEKIILEDIINKVSLKKSALKLQTTEGYVKKLRFNVRSKMRCLLKGEKYGRQ